MHKCVHGDFFMLKLISMSKNELSSFLDVCFKYTDSFTLSRAPWFACTCQDLELALMPFLIREISTPKWFGYDYTGLGQYCQHVHVFIYRAAPAAKEILFKYLPNIFFDIEDDAIPGQTLEGLCFFSQNILFAGSVSHEHMLWAYPADKRIMNQIEKTGEWEYCDDPIPDVGSYFTQKR